MVYLFLAHAVLCHTNWLLTLLAYDFTFSNNYTTIDFGDKELLAHFQLKFKVYRRLYSRDLLSLNRAISLVEI